MTFHLWLNGSCHTTQEAHFRCVLRGTGPPAAVATAAALLSVVVPRAQSTLSLHVHVQSRSAFYNYNYLLTAFKALQILPMYITIRKFISH